MESTQAAGKKTTVLGRIGEIVLKILGLFVILEPIWMLLPFAGFLYGSVLHIQTLNQNPHTAWLTHFVFPVLTGGWLGPILVVVGFGIFLVGAGQIYWAKFRRSGLVSRGLYRFVRHPQYIALTLFGGGILLTWGRAITFLAFFMMMFLYYYLAKSEERICIRLFGDDYLRYRERTSFIFPGDRHLRPLRERLPRLRIPAFVRVTVAFVAVMAVCFGLMWLIDAVKVAGATVPYMTATVPLGQAEPSRGADIQAGQAAGMPFVQEGRVAVVRGPYFNAFAAGFAERVLLRLRKSEKLEGFLSFLDQPGGDVVIVFCGPYDKPDQPATPGMRAGKGPSGRGPAPDPRGTDRVRLILMRCTLAEGATIADALADKAKRTIKGGFIAQVNVGLPEGEDLVEGGTIRPGPGFPGEQRWDFFIQQFARQPAAARQGYEQAVVPGRAASATLVLVQAPILRTRLDPAFAEEIRDRLAESPKMRDQLRKSGVGGDVVAVAFPRPGPNWYREHMRKPQISPFIILARLKDAGDIAGLFRPGGRDLLSAFTAEMDFKIERPADSVGEIGVIGARRDLEERWRFFLSGVGGGMHMHIHPH